MMAIETKWIYFAAALVVAAIVIPVTIYTMQPDPMPDAPGIATQEKHAQASFGPGLLTNSKPASPLPATTAAVDSWVPSGLAVTPDQHLVMNQEMRVVFDYFLQPDRPGDRSAQLGKLQAYLKATLPTAAYDEATPIVSNYVKYLVAHDTLNADIQDQIQTANVSNEKLTENMTQTTRMRQAILGVNIAQLWFAEEDVGMQQFIAKRGITPQVALSEVDK